MAARAKGGSCGASFLPPCRSVGERVGGTPLVRTAGAPATHAASEPQQPNHQAGAVPSPRCGTTYTADADASPHPDLPHPERPALAGSEGSGPPRSPLDRTARTTGLRTGTPSGCAATASCTPSRHATHGPGSPHARERHSGHHGQSARGTRVPSTGDGVVGARITSQGWRKHQGRARIVYASSTYRSVCIAEQVEANSPGCARARRLPCRTARQVG